MKEIPLTQGKVALVDDDDFEWLSQFKWYAVKFGRTFYAVRQAPRVNGKQRKIWMHREVLGPSVKSHVFPVSKRKGGH